jgi:hypothetical protein
MVKQAKNGSGYGVCTDVSKYPWVEKELVARGVSCGRTRLVNFREAFGQLELSEPTGASMIRHMLKKDHSVEQSAATVGLEWSCEANERTTIVILSRSYDRLANYFKRALKPRRAARIEDLFQPSMPAEACTPREVPALASAHY